MITRRDFFATVGGGIVVLVAGDELLLAQETGGVVRGRNTVPVDVSAWLHVAEDGSITGYTGKVEVGQNARTSLTQAVATTTIMSNAPAIALYERLGYTIVGELRDYIVHGQSEWLLRKSVAPLADWTTRRGPLAFDARRTSAK